MTLEEARDNLAAALKTACEEHGRPNSFSARELYLYYGGPQPMLAGHIGKRFLRSLWQALGGESGWGDQPGYSGGRFDV